MNDRFEEKDLLAKGFVPDGNGGYRPLTKEEKTAYKVVYKKVEEELHKTMKKVGTSAKSFLPTVSASTPLPRSLTLKLFGEPMPKQSVRAFQKHGGGIGTFQPKKYAARVKDYQAQIAEQLPEGFRMFTTRVYVRKMHFVYAPLKSFSKAKMQRIEAGEIFYKETRPDLSDNLKKLPLDAMSGIVYKDDGLIVSEDNVKKYYGSGNIIIIELEGY